LRYDYLTKLTEYKENSRLEVKKASDGLPKSLWDTYSAFANTNGGFILLGIEELADKSFHVIGLENPEKLVCDFWNAIHDKNKISSNILTEHNVRIETVENAKIIIVEVPRARIQDRPVYLNKDYLNHSYRRNGEGDYRCTPAEVRSMLRDAEPSTQDMLVLKKMQLDVFDFDSVQRYRNRLDSVRPAHVWKDLDNNSFLYKLGCIDRDAETGDLHPTAAGLLTFGHDYEIVKEYPNYFLDYQEHYEDTNPDVR
jgi:predicted HTH transcriptional regulator